jgi:hypothetical protein
LARLIDLQSEKINRIAAFVIPHASAATPQSPLRDWLLIDVAQKYEAALG